MDKNEAAVALGKNGGKKRWEGRTDKEKLEHTRLMGKKSGEARRKRKKHIAACKPGVDMEGCLCWCHK